MQKQRIIALLLVFLAVTITAVYCNYYLGIDVVYSHLFYIIIIMMGFWFPRYVLPAALFMGIMHISLEYLNSGMFSLNAFLRVVIMIMVATVIFRWRNELHDKERELQSTQEVMKSLLANIPNLLTIYDKKGTYIMVSNFTAKVLGCSPSEAEGKHFSDLLSPSIVQSFSKNTEQILQTKKSFSVIDQIPTDEGPRTFETLLFPLQYEGQEIELIGAIGIDITERKKAEDEKEYLSFHDQLTGLYNRRFFEDQLKRLDIPGNLPLTLVMADVNGLKLVNDAFGHLQGDKVLKRVAQFMKTSCRANDIVARIGGDEFIILLPKTGPKEAEHIIDRLKTFISQERIDLIELSVSFGWASKTQASESMEEIYKRAEDLMYQNKLYESPSMRSNTIKTIIQTMYEKLPGEKEHSDRVSKICEQIGTKLECGSDKIAELKTAALLHDIGKIILDEAILHKLGQLTKDEWKEVKRHPETGYRILSSVNEMSQLAEYILAHHENWDGTGYPRGLKGEEIPLQSRIIRIADSFDAMTNSRSYRKPFTVAEAIEEIKRNAGTQFDPEMVAVVTGTRLLTSL